jgi:peptidoglycan hydrolase-like protein with peptidoglycan-binding domain/DNA invertase Pin-like site-specific DNA recombinase
MQRTYEVPPARVGLGGVIVALLLLACPGTSIAGGASSSTREAGIVAGSPLQQGAGYGNAEQADRVRALQRALKALGWSPGRADGLFGPRTEGAVVRFQRAAGLSADGIVGPHTGHAIQDARRHSLRRGAGYAEPGGAPAVRRLQRELRVRGLRPGPVDGRFGPRTEAAVARLQRAVRLPASGVVDSRTRGLLAGKGLQTAPTRVDSTPRSDLPRKDAQAQTGAVGGTVSDPATVTVPTMIAAIAAALLVGSLLTLLVAGRRRVIPGIPVLMAKDVEAKGRTRMRSMGHFRGERRPFVLGWPGVRAPRAGYVDAATASSAGWNEVTEPASPELGQARAEEEGAEGVRVLGYASVPQADQHDNARLSQQACEIEALCAERGWRLVEIVRDVEGDNSSKGLQRPGVQYALDRIALREASCLVLSQLGRLTRSAGELGRMLEWLEKTDGRLVAMDVGLDTGSSDGRLAAKTLVSLGAWERQRLGERTRRGLDAARARGVSTGRPAVKDVPVLKDRIAAMRAEGMTLQAIADELNAEGVPTLRGGEMWRPSSVQAAAGYQRPRKPGAARMSDDGLDGHGMS